jgi:hypothetical protein
VLKDVSLPLDWREQALSFPAEGVNGPWILVAQRILRSRGDSALVIEEVQDLVLAATGIDVDRPIRNPAWLERIPSWAVRASLTEVGSPGSNWGAFQRLRAAHDELAVLDRFLEAECKAIEEPRTTGPDWHLVVPRGAVHVEVKSKGDREDALDFVYSAIVSAQLLDRTGGGRTLEWRIHGEENEPRFSRPERAIDQVVGLIHEAYPIVSAWLLSKPRVWQCMAPFRTGDFEVRCTCHVPEIELEVHRGGSCLLTLYGTPAEPWFFHPHRPKTDYAPTRLAPATLDEIQALLGRVLTKGSGRQLVNAPPSTVFVVRWHAPFAWDDALSAHEEDTARILEGLTSQANRFRVDPALGLWIEAFSHETSKRIHLNGRAQALLGMESVMDRRG